MAIRLGSAISVLVVAAASSAFAHGDEGGGGGTLLPVGTTRVTFGYDFVNFDGINDATLTALAIQGVGEVHSLKTISVPSLTIGYGITDDFTLAVRLPYLHNQEIRETAPDDVPPGVAARGGVDGIGDLSFTGTYRLLHQEKAGFDAAVILGLKTPTGQTDAVDNFGEEFETEHQPGSGSWDGMFGAAVSKEMGRVTLSGNALYTLNGEGSRQTTLGDRFSYGIAVSYRLSGGDAPGSTEAMRLGGKFDGMMHHGGLDHEEPSGHHHEHAAPHDGLQLDVNLGLNGDWQDKHETAGERDQNTGGHVLYVTPGLKLSVDRWSSFVNFGIPVSTDLNGIQAEPDWRLSTGVSVDF